MSTREITQHRPTGRCQRSRRRARSFAWAYGVYFLWSFAPIFAQSGSLAGHIMDAVSGEPVSWVTVVLEDVDQARTSDERGYFLFPTLPTGKYMLQTMHIGYRDSRFEVQISAGDTLHVDLRIDNKTLMTAETTVEGEHLRPSSLLGEPDVTFNGSKLRQNLGRTIAETIDYEPGIAQRSMGPAPARPVLRGLGGDRLLILEDGERTGDLSGASSDHAVAIEPMTTERIEVLRGPETMIYGSNALGGVVNVVRNYVPKERPERFGGTISWQGESINSGLSGGLVFNHTLGPLALRFDGSARDAGDVSTPRGPLRNTDIRTKNSALGMSIVRPWGHIGAAASAYYSQYGIPPDPIAGHPHGVSIDLERQHLELRFELLKAPSGLERIEAHHSFSRYRHGEFEASGALGTEFGVLTHNGGAQARLRTMGAFTNGTAGLWYEYRNYAAAGLSFTPAAEEYTGAVYFYQEWGRGPWAVNAAMRLDARRVAPRNERNSRAVGPIKTRDFSGVAGGFSGQYSPRQHLVFGATLMRTFRAPGIEELFSEGPHLAAYAYEVGNGSLGDERGVGLELFIDYRPERGRVYLALFRNDINGYIFPKNTGERSLRRADLFLYRTDGLHALMHGAELAFEKQFSRHWKTIGTFSYVRGSLTDLGNEAIPRLPPLQGRIGLTYGRGDALELGGGMRLAAAQKRIGPFEEPTGAYAVLDLSGQYYIHWHGHLHTFAITLENATNSTYRKHLNRVKEILPEPGRNARLLHKVFF